MDTELVGERDARIVKAITALANSNEGLPDERLLEVSPSSLDDIVF